MDSRQLLEILSHPMFQGNPRFVQNPPSQIPGPPPFAPSGAKGLTFPIGRGGSSGGGSGGLLGNAGGLLQGLGLLNFGSELLTGDSLAGQIRGLLGLNDITGGDGVDQLQSGGGGDLLGNTPPTPPGATQVISGLLGGGTAGVAPGGVEPLTGLIAGGESQTGLGPAGGLLGGFGGASTSGVALGGVEPLTGLIAGPESVVTAGGTLTGGAGTGSLAGGSAGDLLSGAGTALAANPALVGLAGALIPAAFGIFAALQPEKPGQAASFRIGEGGSIFLGGKGTDKATIANAAHPALEITAQNLLKSLEGTGAQIGTLEGAVGYAPNFTNAGVPGTGEGQYYVNPNPQGENPKFQYYTSLKDALSAYLQFNVANGGIQGLSPDAIEGLVGSLDLRDPGIAARLYEEQFGTQRLGEKESYPIGTLYPETQKYLSNYLTGGQIPTAAPQGGLLGAPTSDQQAEYERLFGLLGGQSPTPYSGLLNTRVQI